MSNQDELDQLRAELAEARETLNAIRAGAVDAIVVHRPRGNEVYTLSGADRPFRELVERMSDGAATIALDGTILWANRQLADLVGRPAEHLVGRPADEVIVGVAGSSIDVLDGAPSVETDLRRPDGSIVPVRLSVARVSFDGVEAASLVMSDLTSQRETEAVLRQSAAELEGRVAERTAELARTNAEREREANLRRLVAEFGTAAALATREEEIFEDLAPRGAEVIGAACVVYRPSPDGRHLDAVGVAGYDAATSAEFHEWFAAHRLSIDEGWPGRALVTGTVVVRPYIDDEERSSVASSLRPGKHDAALPTRVRAILAVPLRVNGESVGVISFSRYDPDVRPFGEADSALAVELANRASAALERLRLIAERERAARMLQAVFDASPLPIVAVDDALRVTFWNGAAEKVYGWTADEVLGKTPPYAPAEDPGAVTAAFREVAAGQALVEADGNRQTKDGRTIQVHFHSAPFYDEAGRFRGAIGISQDVTERRHAEAMRDAFIDVTAHELKTPITTIYGAIQTLLARNSSLSEAVRCELFEDTAAETERLVHLVDDLVVLSRVERGLDFILDEPLMLQHAARAVIESEARRTARAKAQLRIEGHPGPIAGEHVYIQQVIANLVGNATKYGAPPIEVVVEAVEGGSALRVLDRGPGFEADPKVLFNLYFRDPTATARASGAGIGLFVSRSLIEMMGGRIWAANRPDGGAEFGFFLPEFVDEDAAALDR